MTGENKEMLVERKLAAVTAPDNGTTSEVLAAVLACARAWVPEARIIGNVRAGDIARAVAAVLSSPTPSTHVGGYQDRVAAAHHALFHDDPTEIAERLARFFEECNEACQSLGMTRDEAHQLVNYTYDRPKGEPAKEIGAVLLTLASLCVVARYNMAACGEADLEKLQKPETIARIRAKRATRHGRGPLPGFDPSAALATTEGKP